MGGSASISIHTLRVEGDVLGDRPRPDLVAFLSTPSVWRVTAPTRQTTHPREAISIHTLRVEGDGDLVHLDGTDDLISIHTLRVEGD